MQDQITTQNNACRAFAAHRSCASPEDVQNLNMSNVTAVIVGADIGTYALARSFHELYRLRSVVVTRQILGPIDHSKIITVHRYDDHTTLSCALVALAQKLQSSNAASRLVLIANSDTHVKEIMQDAQRLSNYYKFAFPTLELLDKSANKRIFPELAARFGLTVPPTFTINVCDDVNTTCAAIQARQQSDPLFTSYPLIIKAAMSVGYEKISWPSKAKVYTVQNDSDLEQLITELHDHLLPYVEKYPQIGQFVVQPRVEGNDTYNLSVTAYVNAQHKVTYLGSAHVILEDHIPTALGNPTIMITERYPKLYAQVQRFLEGISWHGFANFDFKVDARTHVAYCFEVNPRIGRNLYYNTAAGSNPMRFLVEDLFLDTAHAACGEVEPSQVETSHAEAQVSAAASSDANVTPAYIVSRICYSVLPYKLALHYVSPSLQREIVELAKHNKIVNPLDYPYEYDFSVRALKRWCYVRIAHAHYWTKFQRNYPYQQHRDELAESLNTRHLQK